MAASGGETCWSLVGRAARGDAPAQSIFGRTYLPLVRAFLATRWRKSPLFSEVDDAVQETFIECFRPDGPLLRADSGRGDFRGFLFGIVRNVAMRFEERVGKLHADGEQPRELEAIESDEDHISVAFDREWARTLMREAGELMSARACDAAARMRVELLRLRFGDNLPIRTIASQWNADVDGVHRSYATARDEFHTCLRQVVSFHAVRTESQLDDECRRLFQMLG